MQQFKANETEKDRERERERDGKVKAIRLIKLSVGNPGGNLSARQLQGNISQIYVSIMKIVHADTETTTFTIHTKYALRYRQRL